MPRTRGTRSIRDAVGWTCKLGHHNPAERYEFFDIPTFICGCHCGEEVGADFFSFFEGTDYYCYY